MLFARKLWQSCRHVTSESALPLSRPTLDLARLNWFVGPRSIHEADCFPTETIPDPLWCPEILVGFPALFVALLFGGRRPDRVGSGAAIPDRVDSCLRCTQSLTKFIGVLIDGRSVENPGTHRRRWLDGHRLLRSDGL